MEHKQEKMRRFLGNICSMPGWNGIFNKEEVEYFFETFADIQYCNGYLRKVKADAITDNIYKLYSVPA